MLLNLRLALLGFLVASSMTINAQFVDATRVKTDAMGHDEWVTQVLSTPTGKEIVSAGVDGRVVFWDVATGKLVRVVQLPTIVLTLSLSPDGQILAAGDASGKVSLIDATSGKIKTSFSADKKIVNAAAWSEDGKFVAAGGTEGIVRLWSVADGKIASEIAPKRCNIMALAFTNSQLVIGLLDNTERKRTAEVWDWQNKKQIRTFDEGPSGLRGISVSQDGKLLAVADFQKATLLNMVLTENGGAEVSLRVLAETDEVVPVAVWDLTTGKRVALLGAETGARSIAFSPDSQLLATAGPNGIMIHDVGSGKFIEVGRIDSQTSIDTVGFSADSKQLFIAREREPLVRFGDGGTDKLVDPFFTSMIMQVREGINSGVLLEMGAKERDANNPRPTKAKSMTGGSNVEIWQISRRTAPQDAKTWEAVAALFDNKDNDARKIIQQVMKDYPNYGEAKRLNAVLFEARDVKKLQNLLDEAAKADANCISCWRSLGDVQYKTEQYLEALKSYDRVLQLKPEYGLVAGHKADAYGALALSLMSSENSQKTMDAAKQALTSALMLRPGVERFYTNLAAAYYFRGDFDTDISLLLIAQRLRPDHARIYYNLGHAYRQKGDKQKAIEAYRRYVQMGEEGEEARVQKAKEFIKELSR